MYSKRILNNTIFANIVVCFIQMQCDIGALLCVFEGILNNTIFANIGVCFIQMQCDIVVLICVFKTF